MLTEKQIQNLYHDAEPLCHGDTVGLFEWLQEGNHGADLTGRTAQDIADEWNELTDAAEDAWMLTVAQAAAHLHRSRAWVYALIRAHRLPAAKFGRDWQIDATDLARVKIGKVGRPAKPRN